MMTRRDRLMATLRGDPVDRPPVCFYEINGLEDTSPANPLNVYSDPSWAPVIALAAAASDRIPLCGVPLVDAPPDPVAELTTVDTWIEAGSHFRRTTIRAGNRTLSETSRRDPDVNTVWVTEHLLKDLDDLDAYLDLPEAEFGGRPDPAGVLATEAQLGDTGIVCIDTPDPLCGAAALFSMADFTIVALTEEARFRRLLDRFARYYHPKTAAVAKALPGRLWRIFGPEYASPPYLPPRLFAAYAADYDRPMVDSIQGDGGFARIHSHGRLKDVLPLICATGCVALDPVEPPPQGDVSLAYVREHYGEQLALFANLEASDLENLPVAQFREKVLTALREGTAGAGRGFCLMPSSCPYGRHLTDRARRNYECMVEETLNWQG